jgi:endonuclease YncB( thermonuclease family)
MLFGSQPAVQRVRKTFRAAPRVALNNKRVARRVALFVCLAFVAALPRVVLAEPNCSAENVDETVTVARVVDGDTLRLSDGRSVRLIGINTPEIGRKGNRSEPFAEQASEVLSDFLAGSPRLGLQIGQEPQDRYGRLLAHVYLANGENVQSYMLKAGLAAHIVVPPNVRHAACYQAAELLAREQEKAVWGSIYRPIAAKQVDRKQRGFRIITGRVSRVGESKRSFWLNFEGRAGEGPREGVAVRIAREDIQRFDQNQARFQPHTLRGKVITVRGWFYRYKKQLMTRLRHPASLEIAEE